MAILGAPRISWNAKPAVFDQIEVNVGRMVRKFKRRHVLQYGLASAVVALALVGSALSDTSSAAELSAAKPTPMGNAVDAANQERLDRQRPLVELADRLQPLVKDADGFAGLYLASERSAVDLYWRGAVPDEVNRAVDAARRDQAQGVTVAMHPAAYTLDQLEQEATRLVGTGTSQGQVVMAAPLADGSGLQVRLDGPATASKAVIASSVPLVVENGPAVVPASRWADTPPFWGGAVMSNGLQHCTTGFGVYTPNPYRRHLLSAGHCNSAGANRWYTPLTTRPIGNTFAEFDPREALLVETDSGGRIYDGLADPTGGGAGEFSKGVQGQALNYNGLWVCHSGAYSGARCGIRVTQIGAVYLLNGVQVSGGVVAEKDDHTSATGQGDSGGPVMIPQPNERVTGAGIISALDGSTQVPCTGYTPPGRVCAWRMLYMDLGLAMQAVGAQLITG